MPVATPVTVTVPARGGHAVTVAELAISARLGRIKDVLQRADATKPGSDVLGVGGISEAMDEFVDNWKIHRGKLVCAVEAHQQMATKSANAYENTDTELAKELTKELTQQSSPGDGRKAS